MTVAKYAQSTQVIINGVDVSPHVFRVDLPRVPGGTDSAIITMAVAALDVTPEGVLVVEIDTRE